MVSRTISSGLLVAALAAAAGQGAWGQDASPRVSESANQSSPVPAASAPDRGPSAPGTGPAGPASVSSASGDARSNPAAAIDRATSDSTPAGTPPGPNGSSSAQSATTKGPAHATKRVCFNLTGRCVEARKSHGTQSQGATAGTTAKDSSGKPLDLGAPDVRTVVPADQLKEPLPSSEQIQEVQESQTVAVKGEGPPPDVPGGFGALWWALNHPSQAWRILAPVE